LISGFLPLLIRYFSKTKLDYHNRILFLWFVTRFIADLCVFIYFKNYHGNTFPIFHISVLIENLLLIAYFNSFNLISRKFKLILFLFPFVSFIFETCFYRSIFDLNVISILTYNISIALLMMKLLFYSHHAFIRNNFILIASLFLFHSISIVYFLVENIRRFDDDLTYILFPFYAGFVLLLNIYYAYFLWSRRKKSSSLKD
jgi:hypothetical protein